MDKKQIDKGRARGEFEILDGYGHDGSIVLKAGTTCYRSEDKTKKSSEDFIKMFKNLKHMSMTEFMWVTLVVRDFKHLLENGIFSKEKFLISNRLADQNTVVSGNARAWLEFMDRLDKHSKHIADKKQEKHIHWIMYNTIAETLNAVNPVMFDLSFKRIKKPLEISFVQSIDKEDVELYEKHHWVAIKFKNVSRGLIDEFVRHRKMSYAVSSTRYIDNSESEFIFPKCEEEDYKIIEESVQAMCDGYNKLVDKGVSKDVARCLLPLGLSQEMVVAGTIEDWKHIFKLRSQPNAHWEIKSVMEELWHEGF